MESILNKVSEKRFFHYFEEICNIPRGSKNNLAISNYLVEFAKCHNLEYYQDSSLNVIIIKEASKGLEDKPTVILQGHMDMVCEKDNKVEHDFSADPLHLKVDGDFIYAEGTTLGGDDGIAVAYMLAILEDDSFMHPGIEAIITTDEEIGMDGAQNLDTSVLKGSYMLNIDSEEEGVLLCSSAGGLTAVCTLPVAREEKSGICLTIQFTGLQGGHSGTEIHKNRTNASLLLARLCYELGRECSFSLLSIDGGQKDNAITREAQAVIVVEAADVELVKKTILKYAAIYKNELCASEPEFEAEITEKKEDSYLVLNSSSTENILFFLLQAPDGVQVFSSNIKGLVESSLNMGILKTEDQQVIFSFAVRSSIQTYKKYLSNKLESLIHSIGGFYQVHGDYAPWEYKTDSKLREICKMAYKKQYGEEPVFEAIHAGLECGILSGKKPDLDIVSLGPDIFDIHTPKERLSISSAIRVYDYVLEIIKEIANQS